MSDQKPTEASNDSSVENEIAKLPARLARIRILDIRENDTALRGIDRTNPQYIELLDSVKKHGVMETITVRDCIDQVTKQKYFGLVNGLQRFSAAKDAGLDEIDAKVIQATDFEVMQSQVILNAKRVDTTPAQYSQHLKRMLTMNPTMTLKELADCLSASEGFIYDRLSLLKLNNEVAKLVDSGNITLTNAYALAKLPADEQLAWKDRAVSLTPQEFVPATAKRVKELNDAKRKAQDAPAESFSPTARQRKLDELKNELNNPVIGKALIEKAGVSTAEEGWKLAIEWTTHLDMVSIAQAKAKDEARKKEAEEAKVRKAEEKAKRDVEGAVAKTLGVA